MVAPAQIPLRICQTIGVEPWDSTMTGALVWVYLSVCEGTKERDLVPVLRNCVLFDGSEIAVVILAGVGGHTTAGKLVEYSFVDRPTFSPFAASTTATAEITISVGRWNLMPTPHLQFRVDGDLQAERARLR